MKNHLYFKNPQEGVVTFKQTSRYPGSSEQNDNNEDSIEINYDHKRNDFRRSINLFEKNYKIRKEKKIFDIPYEIKLIWVKFHGIFDSSKFEYEYLRDFGLEIIVYKNWNTEAIFSIVDNDKFEDFINNLENFINSETQDFFNPNIKFIHEFDFLSTALIFDTESLQENIFLDLIDPNHLIKEKQIIIEHLLKYLDDNNINYSYIEKENYIEIIRVDPSLVEIIVDNYDIVYTINSYAAGVIGPNQYNLAEKEYGFEIEKTDEALPIIGIIDTGIEIDTPLSSIIIDDNSFNLTNTSSFTDEKDHGTAVALISSLGNKLYPNHTGIHKPDALLLSIKIINNQSTILYKENVIELIRRANKEYGVQIFTLTIGYENYKKFHEQHSEYSIALDNLSHELNILICISIGNNYDYVDLAKGQILGYHDIYTKESSNLCSPAESMNNLTIGAYSDNFENNLNQRISLPGTTPSIYSRTFHYNWNLIMFKDTNGNIHHTKTNRHLFKPDILFHGGDVDDKDFCHNTGLKILSARKGFFFNRDIGTSYSAPFAANLAAKIINKYPALKNNLQTVKSLIINSSSIPEPNINFKSISNQTIGHGLPNENIALSSNDNFITLILEDIIYPENIKCFSLKLPSYLISLEHTSQNIVNISSTLCFSFEPNIKSQFTYCPIHLSFLLTKNLLLESYETDNLGNIIFKRGKPINSFGINYNSINKIKIKNSWSQDYYFKNKPLSNVQKTTQALSRKYLNENIDIDGNINFKLAVNCKLHKLLNDIEKSNLKDLPISYSLVITIEELPYKNQTSGRLYEELSAINNLENIVISNIDLEAEN